MCTAVVRRNLELESLVQSTIDTNYSEDSIADVTRSSSHLLLVCSVMVQIQTCLCYKAASSNLVQRWSSASTEYYCNAAAITIFSLLSLFRTFTSTESLQPYSQQL